jgi:hypothetical protein
MSYSHYMTSKRLLIAGWTKTKRRSDICSAVEKISTEGGMNIRAV